MPRKQSALNARISAVAQVIDRSPQTVRKWYADGCDVYDIKTVNEWREAKTKNSTSNGARVKAADDLEAAMNGHRRDSAGMLNLEILDKLPAPVGEGAAAALKRLQGLESIFYSRMLESLARGRSDLITFSLNDYNKITETLRRYEKEVEAAMRDAGQLISRGDAEAGASAVARWFRLGWRLWLSSSVPDLLGLTNDPLAFKAKAESTFKEIMGTVFVKAREAKLGVPKWALSAIREEFRTEVNETN